MFCPNCGAQNPDGSRFCQGCGKPLTAPPPNPAAGDEAWRQNAATDENAQVQGQRVSPNVYLGDDGKYRWVYELDLKKDVTVRRYVLKVFAWIILGFLAAALIMGVASGSPDFWMVFPIFLGIGAFIYLCVFLGMGVYSLIYKGSYWSIFEMDDRGIAQRQMKQTADRTQILSLLIVLGSQDAGTVGYAAAGGIATRYECPFEKITAVKLDAKHDLIDCSRLMGFCPVYAEPEDYDFIVDHIVSHVPEKTAARFRARYH